jgi:hypothetical protein
MYSTTEEYRHVLRHIVQMDPTKYNKLTEEGTIPLSDLDLDEETIDELTYDDQAMSTYLDGVYQNTHTNSLFSRLYLSAAALMLSTNPEIGLAILFSYDYLASFHLCYQSFLVDPNLFSESNRFYDSLIKRLEHQ